MIFCGKVTNTLFKKSNKLLPILYFRTRLQGFTGLFTGQFDIEDYMHLLFHIILFYVRASGGLYSSIYITIHSLINYLCELDTTLRVLNTWYRLHVINIWVNHTVQSLDIEWTLPHNLYSGAKHIPFVSPKAFSLSLLYWHPFSSQPDKYNSM